ncbi:MAG: alpha/beta hydrolase [Oscillospiraceae bacterium]|jgi:pimeloyl-ACP methyl ester carboxylesterase|nr:alpha/beta hydrolase [Oscillospiraceae bacterium]
MPESFEVVCPDLFSLVINDEMNYQNLYRAFSDFCDEIPELLNLCGLSLGGVLALNYTIDNPEKINSLVLIAAQYKMPKTLLKIQTAVFKVLPGFIFKKQGVQKDEFMKTFLGLMKTMADLDFSNKLKDIACPVLILCGDKDHANKKAAKCLAENIPQATLRFIEKAGHEANVASPKELAELITELYEGIIRHPIREKNQQ